MASSTPVSTSAKTGAAATTETIPAQAGSIRLATGLPVHAGNQTNDPLDRAGHPNPGDRRADRRASAGVTSLVPQRLRISWSRRSILTARCRRIRIAEIDLVQDSP